MAINRIKQSHHTDGNSARVDLLPEEDESMKKINLYILILLLFGSDDINAP